LNLFLLTEINVKINYPDLETFSLFLTIYILRKHINYEEKGKNKNQVRWLKYQGISTVMEKGY